MKQRYARVVVIMIFFSSLVFAQAPSYQGYVNDNAGVIDDATEAQITAYIAWLEQNTTAEIGVLTIQTLPQGVSSEKAFATQVFNEWDIGKADVDNGVLVLVVLDTRRIEIETGYGVEGILPDGKVGRIIDNHIDAFRASEYGQGILAVVQDLGAEIQQEPFGRSAPDYSFFPVLLFSVLFAIVIAAVAYNRFGNRCPRCKTRLTVRMRETKEEFITERTCPKCGYKSVKRRKKTGMMLLPIFIGRGSSGGGGGSFGGGSSGGGGAGGSW